jgi:hypothetical protein
MLAQVHPTILKFAHGRRVCFSSHRLSLFSLRPDPDRVDPGDRGLLPAERCSAAACARRSSTTACSRAPRRPRASGGRELAGVSPRRHDTMGSYSSGIRHPWSRICPARRLAEEPRRATAPPPPSPWRPSLSGSPVGMVKLVVPGAGYARSRARWTMTPRWPARSSR